MAKIVQVGGATAVKAAQASPSKQNQGMTASVTTADGNVACSTSMAATSSGAVRVTVGDAAGELTVKVGDAAKTSDCYFSSDSGTTALANNNVPSGALLYWVGSVAGYQLDATYTISFNYAA